MYFLIKVLQDILFNIKISFLNFNIVFDEDIKYQYCIVEGNKSLFLTDIYNSIFIEKNLKKNKSSALNVQDIIHDGLFTVVLPEGQKISYIKMIKNLDFHPFAIQLIGYLKLWTDDVVNVVDKYLEDKKLHDDDNYNSLKLNLFNENFDEMLYILNRYCDLNKELLYNMKSYFSDSYSSSNFILPKFNDSDFIKILNPTENLDYCIKYLFMGGPTLVNTQLGKIKLSNVEFISSFLDDCLFVPQSTKPVNLQEFFAE